MTAFAFIMGVLPMAVSSGARANARHAIGTGVIGGMTFATFLGILLIPVFYVVVRRLLGDTLDCEATPVVQTGSDVQSPDSDHPPHARPRLMPATADPTCPTGHPIPPSPPPPQP